MLRSSIAPIRMVEEGLDGLAPPEGHRERLGRELRGHGGVQRPAHHAPREQIEHDGHEQPTFAGPDVGEVSDPFLVRRGRRELAIQDIRRERVHGHPRYPSGVRGAAAGPGAPPAV